MSTRGTRNGSRGGGSDGWDRPPRGGSRYPRRDGEDGWDDTGRAGSSGGRGRVGGSRGDWDDSRGSRGGSPDRSMRGGRPPARDDWDAPTRRAGPGGSGGSNYAGGSRRPPQGGGLWGDEDFGPRGRPGMGGPGGMRDPRAPRTGRGAAIAAEPEKGKLSFGKALGIIVGMFVLGIAVAFGYFMLTRPNPQVDNTPPVPTNTTAPQITPSAAPKASPTGRLPGAGSAYVFLVAGGNGGNV